MPGESQDHHLTGLENFGRCLDLGQTSRERLLGIHMQLFGAVSCVDCLVLCHEGSTQSLCSFLGGRLQCAEIGAVPGGHDG